MATSLTALVMKIGADTSELDRAATDMRKTMRTVGQVLREAETPQEKLEKRTRALSEALRAGRITTEQYTRGMRHLEGQTERTASKFPMLLRSILPVVTVFSAFHAVRRSMVAIDEAAKGATAVGDAVENYMALTHALGEVAGMDASQAGNTLKIMNQQLSQAAMFGGRGADAIRTLGLSMTTLMAERPAERFTQLVEAIAAHRNESERASLAQALFGRGAKDVMAAINAQTGALRESQQAAKDLGLTMGTEQARQIEAANDAIGRLRQQGKVGMGELGASLSPLILGFEKLVIKVRSSGTAAFEMGKRFALAVWPFGQLVDAAKMFASVIKPIVSDIETVAEKTEEVARSTERFARPVREVSEEYTAQKEELERQIQILNLGVDAYERMQIWRSKLSQPEKETLINLREEIRLTQDRSKREEEIARIRKQAADAFGQEAKSALAAAKQTFEVEKQRRNAMRQHMASGPESMGVGSAEAARFLAEQANAARALQAMPDETPGERQIIEEARKQLEIQRQQLAEEKRMTGEVIKLQRITEQSAPRRYR